MDHDHTYKQCPHGRCLNHDPEWENIGKERYEPDPGFFGFLKTYRTTRCCGKPMRRYKIMQMRRCKKCRRTEDHQVDWGIAFCRCCGYHFDNSNCDD